jgi:ribosome biogenesis GTPase / thiamine phosphate phosphatase
MDTPGMRELQLWDAEDGWREAFSDIEEIAANCRFRDCKHQKEAGCAVRAAIQEGALDALRLSNYHKTERELARAEHKEKSAEQRRIANTRKQGGKGYNRRSAAAAARDDYGDL